MLNFWNFSEIIVSLGFYFCIHFDFIVREDRMVSLINKKMDLCQRIAQNKLKLMPEKRKKSKISKCNVPDESELY